MIEAVYIPSENINDCWNLVDQHIANALERSGNHYNSSDIQDKCSKGEMQLWIGWDNTKPKDDAHYATCVTEIIVRPNSKTFSIFIMTGRNMKDWVHNLDKLAEFARSKNCTHFEAVARPGWERVLKRFNFKKTHVYLERKL